MRSEIFKIELLVFHLCLLKQESGLRDIKFVCSIRNLYNNKTLLVKSQHITRTRIVFQHSLALISNKIFFTLIKQIVTS